MSKSILDTPIEEFEKALPKISFGTLKNLLSGLFTFIKKNHKNLTMESILDLERKQTKIWKELSRRGYKLDTEFMNWLYGQNDKRIY